MISTVRVKATVKPGGFIEVQSDELPEGATVEVIVLIETSRPKGSKPKRLSRSIGAMKGKRSF